MSEKQNDLIHLKTEEAPTTNLPKEVIYLSNEYFNAYISPGMDIVPGEALSIYSEDAIEKTLAPNDYKKYVDAQKREVDFALKAIGVETGAIRERKDLDRMEKEYLFKLHMAYKLKYISEKEYLHSNTEPYRNGLLTDEERKSYTNFLVSTQKVGLRNMRWHSELGKATLTCDYVKSGVPFQMYRNFSDPSLPHKYHELATPSSTAALVITKDNKILVQNRSSLNSKYREVPGASIGGMWDKELKDGKVVPPSNESAKRNIMKEAGEEININDKHIENIITLGLSEDKVSVHNEIMFLIRLGINTEEINKIAEQITNDEITAFDFDEKYFAINATREAVEKLLTEVKCHIPSTHAAAFLAFALMLRKDEMIASGTTDELVNSELKKYSTDLSGKMLSNYHSIDSIVSNYWKNRGKNANKYDPTLTLYEQGLPSLHSELLRNGLIEGINTPQEDK
jgi:hypothetical protein